MFQQIDTNQSELNIILEQQLECFRSVLKFSKKSVDQVEKLSINILMEMLHYRQEWIDKIQHLEKKRQALHTENPDAEIQEYMEEISRLAAELVEIDKQIYHGLQERKMRYVQQISSTAMGRQVYVTKRALREKGESKLLDITQE